MEKDELFEKVKRVLSEGSSSSAFKEAELFYWGVDLCERMVLMLESEISNWLSPQDVVDLFAEGRQEEVLAVAKKAIQMEELLEKFRETFIPFGCTMEP